MSADSLLEDAATRRYDSALGIALPLLEYLTRQEPDCDLEAVHEPLLRAVADLPDDYRDAFDLLLGLNRTYLRLSRPAEAADCLMEAQKVACDAEDDQRATEAAQLLLVAFQNRLAAARDAGNEGRIADSLVLLAGAHSDLGDPQSARLLLLEALALYRTTDDVVELAEVLTELGDVSRAIGLLAESVQFLQEGVRLFEQTEDQQGLGLALESLSHTLTDLVCTTRPQSHWSVATHCSALRTKGLQKINLLVSRPC